MHERATEIPDLFAVTDSFEREFDERLPELSRLAFRVAYSVVRNRQDAEDVAQDALVRAHRRLPTLRDPERYRPWIVRLTWRLALDHQRGDTRRRQRELAHVQLASTDVRPLMTSGRADALWTAIDSLPEKLRLVLVLTSLEGHNVEEVSRLVGVPPGTVKSRLFTARQRLRELLK